MYTLYKFHFLNGISEINQLFGDILIIWPAPVCDLLYEKPAKVIFFCDLLFSTKNHPSYGKEHSVKLLPLYL